VPVRLAEGHQTIAARSLSHRPPRRDPMVGARRFAAAVRYRSLGFVIDNVLLHDAVFMADFAKAKAEVRRAIGLPYGLGGDP
jgi:hypothetical protein